MTLQGFSWKGALAALRAVFLLNVLALLASCGGDGGSSSAPPEPLAPVQTVAYTPGVYRAFTELANYCANPRQGIDPFTGRPYPDRQGSVAMENNFLRSWLQDTYLWYADLADLDPNLYASPVEYFNELRSWEITDAGYYKDQFHWAMDSFEWNLSDLEGMEYGYGAQWRFINNVPPRELVVTYVLPGSPAAVAGIARGDRLLKVDGVDLVNDDSVAGIDILNAAIFPASPQETHDFVFLKKAGSQLSLTLTSQAVENPAVMNAKLIGTASGKIGYLQFNDHSAPAEAGLLEAMSTLQAADIDDLVLDLRYNEGGYIFLASQLAYMVAGAERTQGKTFSKMVFNDKHSLFNPVTQEHNQPLTFLDKTLGFSAPADQPLPSLNLGRVFVLTSHETCSASEVFINALRGIDVDVIQIGGSSCGKPYGFYPQDNCGTTYFALQFQGVNAKGFGDFPYGFSPQNSRFPYGVKVPGCAVAEDFQHELGDSHERLLATALAYRAGGETSCPVSAPLASLRREMPHSARPAWALKGKSPLRRNSIWPRP